MRHAYIHPSRAQWRKSSRSGSGTNCVEVASRDARVAVRDSKIPDGPHLAVTARQWDRFAARVKQGKLDL